MMVSDIIISGIRPQIDGGKFPAKRIVGDVVQVSANIYTFGKDSLKARIRYRHSKEKKWRFTHMVEGKNDQWTGTFTVDELGNYQFRVEAWVDQYNTWLKNVKKWSESSEDISLDMETGLALLRGMSRSAGLSDRKYLSKAFEKATSSSWKQTLELMGNPRVLEIVDRNQKMHKKTSSGKTLSIFVENRLAGFASWYELFPRSQGSPGKKSGTFQDVIGRLDDISSMGFDVLYLTPIHPIGITNRRGKDGSGKAKAQDPGSPWAIGNKEGGHKAIEKSLGTIEDFRRLVSELRKRGMKVALDIAFHCSPDHPYVEEHPDWFYRRADGTIRYAENPPKKYFDIYPLNFDTGDRKELYRELLSIFLYWANEGVEIFRVDNPHTKPFSFWEWIIKEVRKTYPDTIFLSEAFTKPNVMYRLSKIGFSQSYTYFTWRNYHWELRDYFTELSRRPVSDHFRPMLFTNTPDILPAVLQKGGRAAFKLRAILAATLSPLWGIYSGFELCENEAIPGREEYLNSEKYEVKYRDWNSRGNIKELISTLNNIRRNREEFQEIGNVAFHQSNNPNILFYSRASAKSGRMVMVLVNINPYETHEATVKVPTESAGICDDEPYEVEDLLTGDTFTWRGIYNYVRLIPDERPAHILTVVDRNG